MTTIERIQDLRLRWREIDDAAKAKEVVKTYDDCSVQFQKQLLRIDGLRRKQEALGPALERGKGSKAAWQQVAKRLADLRKQLAEEVSHINLNELLQSCQALAGEWERDLERDWRAWRDRHKAVEIQRETLEKLDDVAPEPVKKLRQLQRERLVLEGKDLPGNDDVERIQSQAAESRDALAEMGFADDGVREGFQRLVVDGVGLEELANPKSPLRLWLEEKGLIGGCKVKLG